MPKIPPKYRKAKGDRAERQLVKLYQASKIPARRTRLSDQAAGEVVQDLVVGPPVHPLKVQSKVRADGHGFATLYTWLDGVDVLHVKAGRQPWLAVVRLEDHLTLLVRAGYASEPSTGHSLPCK